MNKENHFLDVTKKVAKGVEADLSIALQIIREICEMTGVSPKELVEKTRAHRVAYPRMLAMAFLRRYTELTHFQIRDLFRQKHHGSTINAQKRIEQICADNPYLAKVRKKIEEKLNLGVDVSG